MVSLDKAVIARLKTAGENFEIFVDPDLAAKYKAGEQVDLKELLAAETIFKDATAGEKASEHVMEKVLLTTDLKNVVDKILRKGELHLTTEQKRKKTEDIWKQIITIIARNAMNPQTGSPHPPARIEKAMEEAKFNVVITKSAQEQVEGALKAIKPIIPITFAKKDYAVRIPAVYAGNVYGMMKGFGDLKKEEWDKNGNLLMLIEIPAGLQDEFYNKLNGLTHGEVQIKIMK
jgi:ribosome maturation protein SDO1